MFFSHATFTPRFALRKTSRGATSGSALTEALHAPGQAAGAPSAGSQPSSPPTRDHADGATLGRWDATASQRTRRPALKVASRGQLDELFTAIKDWPGVDVEFAPEPSGGGPKIHAMIYEPGGNRIEFSYDPR